MDQRQFKTEGIVLKKRQLLNKDYLITFFTEELGKIVVSAKGVRDIKSRRISSIMTGNLINILLYVRRDHYYLQGAQVISLFSNIKKHENRQKTLYFFLYILDKILPEGQKEIRAYTLQKRLLIELSKAEMNKTKRLTYGNNLLKLLGYQSKADTLEQMIDNIEEVMGKKIPPFII